jgi:hypothetical protein
MPRRLSRPRYTLLRAAPAGLPQRAGGAARAGGTAWPPAEAGGGGNGAKMPFKFPILAVRLGEQKVYEFFRQYLAPFDDSQVEKFLHKRYPVWQWHQRKKARDLVRKIPLLSARPMLLSYLPDLIDSEVQIEHAFQLYEALIEKWLEREDWINRDKLRVFSEGLAVDLYTKSQERGAERIPHSELAPLAREWNLPDLEDLQLRGRSLLNRDAEGNYKFAHRSIMEYLFVVRLLHEDSDCYNISLTDQMKQFLVEIVSSKFPEIHRIHRLIKKADIDVGEFNENFKTDYLVDVFSVDLIEFFDEHYRLGYHTVFSRLISGDTSVRLLYNYKSGILLYNNRKFLKFINDDKLRQLMYNERYIELLYDNELRQLIDYDQSRRLLYDDKLRLLLFKGVLKTFINDSKFRRQINENESVILRYNGVGIRLISDGILRKLINDDRFRKLINDNTLIFLLCNDELRKAISDIELRKLLDDNKFQRLKYKHLYTNSRDSPVKILDYRFIELLENKTFRELSNDDKFIKLIKDKSLRNLLSDYRFKNLLNDYRFKQITYYTINNNSINKFIEKYGIDQLVYLYKMNRSLQLQMEPSAPDLSRFILRIKPGFVSPTVK